MKKLGYISIIIVSLAWGISFIATKIALGVFTPLTVMFFKFFVSTILFVVLMKVKKETLYVKKKDRLLFLGSATFGFILYFYFEGMAINMLNASSAALILAFEPIVVMVLSYLFNNEKLTLEKKIAIPITIVGVYMIVMGASGNNDVIGYIFMFLAILMWGFYVVVSSRLINHYSTIKITAIQAFIAFIVFAPFIFSQDVSFENVKMIHVLAILYLGVVPSGLALFLYIFSIKAIGSTTTSLFVNFVPVVTIILGVSFLNETLTLNKVIGGMIIVVTITIIVFIDLRREKLLT